MRRAEKRSGLSHLQKEEQILPGNISETSGPPQRDSNAPKHVSLNSSDTFALIQSSPSSLPQVTSGASLYVYGREGTDHTNLDSSTQLSLHQARPLS